MSRRLLQPPETGILLRSSDGSTVRLEAQDLVRLCKLANQAVDIKRENLLNHLVQKIDFHEAKVIYLEVQHALIFKGTGEGVEYKYTGGTAVAIGRHHLLTTFHMLRPRRNG